MSVFLRQTLRENSVNLSKIDSCAIFLVVPHLLFSWISCYQLFNIKPFFTSMDTTNLDMSAVEAHQVDADKIASCIGEIADHPKKDLLIIYLGPATTFGLVTKGKKIFEWLNYAMSQTLFKCFVSRCFAIIICDCC